MKPYDALRCEIEICRFEDFRQYDADAVRARSLMNDGRADQRWLMDRCDSIDRRATQCEGSLLIRIVSAAD
jgi:hypothetical protein